MCNTKCFQWQQWLRERALLLLLYEHGLSCSMYTSNFEIDKELVVL